MTLKHFFSAINDSQSKTPFHREPTEKEVKIAIEQRKLVLNDFTIFSDGSFVEVKKTIPNGFGGNVYRDLYSIN